MIMESYKKEIMCHHCRRPRLSKIKGAGSGSHVDRKQRWRQMAQWTGGRRWKEQVRCNGEVLRDATLHPATITVSLDDLFGLSNPESMKKIYILLNYWGFILKRNVVVGQDVAPWKNGCQVRRSCAKKTPMFYSVCLHFDSFGIFILHCLKM